MTELFHGSLSEKAPKGALAFWGEFDTAVERAESLFMNHGYWRAYQDGSFLLIDPQTQQVSGIETPEEVLEKFANFMSNICLKSYEVDISRPLSLVDCWEDDPIGSGAMHREAFIQDIMPKFTNFLREQNPREIGTDVYWAGNKPTEYWQYRN